MSRVSEISQQYHNALSFSQKQYERLVRERAAATESFYKKFFHILTDMPF